MARQGRLLSMEEQINYLKTKGVGFSLMSENAAREYLARENNYFRVTAYRKNYPKHPAGARKGQYVQLEFAYLVDIAGIDALLGDVILAMALDIERQVGQQIVRLAESHGEDGYEIVDDFVVTMQSDERHIFENELARNRSNIYCRDLVQKYDQKLPVWALVEVIPFGRLLSLYKFTAERYESQEMMSNFYYLLACKKVRNAAAHGNCILNDIMPAGGKSYRDDEIVRALNNISGMRKGFRTTQMRSVRLQQIVILLYMHQKLVFDRDALWRTTALLQLLKNRMCENKAYYASNPRINSALDFLTLVIDNWFGMA